ncbi:MULTISPECIES: ABC transporter permease [Sutcliffiella]|uniref:ABC transporter permease n=1 Tax=Sutcliffiella cohnii TaxID=33932 RepID=A0A223KPT6_9BACI|nr:MULTISPECIES: FtsX-like permease family protein [Sutcliffiella]AST91469.1 hypothetical protein BC6307_09335 [Sutcliffiella cohnii]WBL17299.1 FtsX-like permease family protein [Sutcliffiella sp. NC1]
MKFRDKNKFVKDNMKKNKSRVFMTVLATAMACAFLMVLASVGFGLHKYIVQDITETRLVTEVEIHGKDDPDNQYLTDEDIRYFESIENVKTVTRYRSLDNYEAFYTFDEYKVPYVTTRVVHYPSELQSNFELEEGRMPEAANEVVIGYHFSHHLEKDGEFIENAEVNMLNKEIILTVPQMKDGEQVTKDFALKVVGIAKQPTKQWTQDNYVNISDETLKEIEKFTETRLGTFLNPNLPEETIEQLKDFSITYSNISVYTNNMEQVMPILEEVQEKGYYAYSAVQELKEVNMIFSVMKVGLIFIGTIAVIIASIGIFNTMSMAVTERTQDIGIMKAIGGSPKMIKSLFLMESAYIGIIGSVIGALAAYAVSYGVNLLLPVVVKGMYGEEVGTDILLSYIPWSLTLISVGISVIVAILSGLKPAAKATRIDVLKALRRDI